MGLRLIIEDYEGSTTVFPLGDGAVTIGREEGNTIRLDEKNISRRHLRLVPADAGWMVEDLHSYNGVRVNGEVVDNGSEVHEGDLIQIGDYQLLIGDETSTRATMELGPAVIAAANDLGAGAAAMAGANAVTMDDSPGARGPVVGPAAVPVDQDWDEPKSSGGGGKVLVALLLLGAMGGGAWYMFGRGAAANEAVASQEAKGATTAAAAVANGDAGAAADAETAAQDSQAETEAGIEAAPEATAEPEPEPEPELIEPDPEPELIEPDPEPEPELIEPDPEPAATPTKKKKKKKKKKAAAPTQSADELLSAARSAQLKKSYAKAYSLAKQSYAAKASAAAAKVMGVAACKMGDASKAKSAYAKLSGSNKSALKSVCSSAGISL